MRLIGKCRAEDNTLGCPEGGLIALEVATAVIDTFNPDVPGRQDIDAKSKCFIRVRTGHFEFHVMHHDEEYLTLETAEKILRDLFAYGSADLGNYKDVVLWFRGTYPIKITNDTDFFGNAVPLATTNI